MRIFKNKEFNGWAAKMEIEDGTLKIAIDEITKGLHNGSLGGHLFKKRIGLKGRGKRGGVRTIGLRPMDWTKIRSKSERIKGSQTGA